MTRLIDAAGLMLEIDRLTTALSQAEHKVVRLREALRWYAERENYDYEGRPLTNAAAPRWKAPMLDLGERARQALLEQEAA